MASRADPMHQQASVADFVDVVTIDFDVEDISG